jgi:hypothetical protein
LHGQVPMEECLNPLILNGPVVKEEATFRVEP